MTEPNRLPSVWLILIQFLIVTLKIAQLIKNGSKVNDSNARKEGFSNVL